MNDGTEFERRVERWLQRSRGAVTQRRSRHPGHIAKWPYECDVQATISPARSMTAFVASAFMFVMSIVCLAADAVDVGAVMMLFAVGIGGASLLASRSSRRIWIECKDRDSSVTRLDVLKLADAVDDVRNGRALWVPTEAWLVSSSRFDRDAVAFARERDVRCWLETPQGFVEVEKMASWGANSVREAG